MTQHTITLSKDSLITVKHAITCTAKDKKRPVLECLYINRENKELIAADGFRLIVLHLPAELAELETGLYMPLTKPGETMVFEYHPDWNAVPYAQIYPDETKPEGLTTILLNPTMLKELAAMGTDYIEITITNPLSPVILRGTAKNEHAWYSVIMPIAVTKEGYRRTPAK